MKIHQPLTHVNELDEVIQTENVHLESVYDEDGFLELRRGHTVQRGSEAGQSQRGQVARIINWHWANVWWIRPNGTVYCEASYLPDCQWVKRTVHVLAEAA